MKYLVTEEIAETEELVHAEFTSLKQAEAAYAKKGGFAQVHVCGHDTNPPQPCTITHSKGVRVADIVPEPVAEEMPEKEVADVEVIQSDNPTPSA